jgi:tetratricopeptide (TPR) repeat protein
MKRAIFLAGVCLGFCAAAQQSSVKGVIAIQNSLTETGKRIYVSNAEIKDNFRNIQPALTNGEGQFLLIYVGVPEKTTVHFDARKPNSDLDVVNISALDAVTGQRDSVRIYMASKEKLAEYRKQIYYVGKTAAEKRLEELVKAKTTELTAIQTNSAKNANRINQLEEELKNLEDKRKKIEEQAEDLAQRYAAINMDDASPLFREAFLMFKRGSLDSALLVLNELNLANMVSQILEEREKVAKLKEEVSKRDSLEKQRTKDVGEALLFKADLHKTKYEFDSASTCYKLLIKLDPSNADYLYNYAYFLDWFNQHDNAIAHYLRALAIYREKIKNNAQVYEPKVANTQSNLGSLYKDQHAYDKAEQVDLEALAIRMRLAKDNPQVYEHQVARIQNNLGILYAEQHLYDKAEQAFLKALSIYSQLSKDNPQVYDDIVAATQNGLGMVYADQHFYDKAEQAFLEAITIRKRLAKDNPKVYEPIFAETQNNLGILYDYQQVYEKAEQAILEALSIYRRLSKNNPHVYDPYVALAQNNLGMVYDDLHAYDKAEQAYLETLSIYRRLAEDNPRVYSLNVANAQNNLGISYQLQHVYDKSEQAFLEALSIYRQLSKDNPQAFEPLIANTQDGLGVIYAEQHAYEKAEEQLIESYKLGRKWMKVYPDAFSSDALKTACNLLDLYNNILDSLKQEAFKGNLLIQFKTLEIDLNEVARLDTAVKQKLISYYSNSCWYLLFASKFTEAEEAAQKAFVLDTAQVWVKTNLAHALLFQGKYAQALNVYKSLKPLKNDEGKSYALICREDLAQLEKQGITNKDVEKIKAFLKEP